MLWYSKMAKNVSVVGHHRGLNKSEKTRCSLAFNVIPTVGFGEETSLTELKF